MPERDALLRFGMLQQDMAPVHWQNMRFALAVTGARGVVMSGLRAGACLPLLVLFDHVLSYVAVYCQLLCYVR